ncbi:MAG: Na/Pi cotransporter family protein, partial [Clostridia bacterium]|nr:Na/Pi cotransporter family protein [Clostridia bacterium]
AYDMRESIAIAHTTFNVANTLVWLPLVWLMVRLIRLIIPGEDPVVEKRLAFIDYKVIRSPAIAVDLATKELARMTEIARQMTNDSHALIKNHTTELETRVFTNEATMDYLEDEIVRYLSNIFRSASITESDSSRIAGLMHLTNDIERIGDHCSNIADTSLQMHEAGLTFSDIATKELDEAFTLVESMVDSSITALRNNDLVIAGKIINQENQMDKVEAAMRESHMERLNEGKCDPRTTVIFLEMIHTMERIADHCHNIADFVVSDDDYQVHQGND